MLDAAAGALALEMLDASSEFVQAGSDFAPLALAPNEAAGIANSPPENIQIQPLGSIDENGIATLELVFEDADPLDSHTVEVDWGDGPVEVFNVPTGSQFFATTHQYLDDDPTVTSSDVYTVNVKVIDAAGDFAQASAPLTVNNVAPSNLQIVPPPPIDENGVGSLELTFEDPGTLDSHSVEVDWGDGSVVEVFNVPQGSRFFGTTHQYLDDDPTNTAADDYAINVRVLDDDGGEVAGSTTINVSNIAPSNLQIASIADVNENGFAQLDLTFDDPGTLDTHQVEVDWGDGNVELLDVAPGARAFSAMHQYLDDDPTGTAFDQYAVNVRLFDDDLGEIIAQPLTLTVSNVAPSGVAIDPLASIDENGVAVLNLAFTDPGTRDSHTVEIDWGDGSAIETLPVAAGARLFTATHQYLDDNPTGTASDPYTIKVRVRDDDLGVSAAVETSVTVNNVAPLNVSVLPAVTASNEGGLVNLSVMFDDPGSQDSHTYEVDWGDGTAATVGATLGRSFAASHTYADNGDYAVTVMVADDDLGIGTAMATVTVGNVAPMLTVVGNQTVNEGSPLMITNIGTFTDPGFNNPLNPVPGGETAETFTFTINWGDGTAVSAGAATVDAPGGVGILTGGSFDGLHTYADNGVYTVTVTVFDDDSGQHQRTFEVTVLNVAPTMTVVGNQTIDEGSSLSLSNIGSFTDPGFENPLNAGNGGNGGEIAETFTYTINWGDGTAVSAGAATVDVAGSPGTLTAGSFDGQHTFADDGVYTVTVTVFDDDLGQHQRTFEVTVLNVAPTLSVAANQTTNEGSALSLTNIGSFTDPGFNNPLNPLAGGETTETFTFTINWGDGTAVDGGAATVDVLGSPGTLTAGSMDGLHTYADDGIYTVTVTVLDDDAGQSVRTFTVTVNNVAPTLNLTVDASLIDAIDEGGVTQVNITGLFSDPGFDNPNNRALFPGNALPETEETFTYEVDWGDGNKEVFNLDATNGSPGVNSTGVIARFFTHQYLDNDLDGVRDARYTVTVTVFDDDLGSNSKTFEVIVYNVNPTLDPIAATAVNNRGVTTLTLRFDDSGPPILETFEILIDWGDRLADAPLERFEVEPPPPGDTRDGSRYIGPTPNTFVFTHTYLGPPNPLSPAADIVISVKIQDDDFGTATSRPDADPLTIDGQSNIETVAITNPGIGSQTFRIDTTPQVALLTFPERVMASAILNAQEARVSNSASGNIGGSAGDSKAASERYLELRIINPDGTLSEGYRLRPEVLNDLQALFRNLPDNHYAIYLVQSETSVRRLVIDVFVRNGKVIDPGDDSEGARDRPPTDDAATAPAKEQPVTPPETDDAATSSAVEPNIEPPHRSASSTALYHRTALAGVALALSGAGRNWQRQMEQALVKAKPSEWKRLRTAGHRRRRKPR